MEKDDSQASEFARNSLAILMKHNLVKAWQAQLDLVTFYNLDEKECLLRLSLPRYLVSLKKSHSTLHQSIIESVVIYGSLLKSEVVSLVSNEHHHKENIERAFDELIQTNYLIGA